MTTPNQRAEAPGHLCDKCKQPAWQFSECEVCRLRSDRARLVEACRAFADIPTFWAESMLNSTTIAWASKDGKTSYRITLGQARTLAALMKEMEQKEKQP